MLNRATAGRCSSGTQCNDMTQIPTILLRSITACMLLLSLHARNTRGTCRMKRRSHRKRMQCHADAATSRQCTLPRLLHQTSSQQAGRTCLGATKRRLPGRHASMQECKHTSMQACTRFQAIPQVHAPGGRLHLHKFFTCIASSASNKILDMQKLSKYSSAPHYPTCICGRMLYKTLPAPNWRLQTGQYYNLLLALLTFDTWPS